MGAVGQGYEEIARRRASCTGGLWCHTSVFRHAVDPDRCLRRMRIGLKTLDAEADRAFALLADLVRGIDSRDRPRLKDTLKQACAAYRTGLVSGGQGTAVRQASRGFSREAALDHLFGSPDTLRFVEDLDRNFDERVEDLAAKMEQIRGLLLNRRRWTLSFTGSDRVFARLARCVEEWAGELGDAEVLDTPSPFTPFAAPPREGLAGPMDIAHCARVMQAPHLSNPDAPLFDLGVYLLRFDYSWKRWTFSTALRRSWPRRIGAGQTWIALS